MTISASYTHLQPYRRHVLLLDTDTMNIRLLSSEASGLTDSGWHGIHTWCQGCTTFYLNGFHYAGLESRVKHRFRMVLGCYAVHWGFWRFTGYEVARTWDGQPLPVSSDSIIEVVFDARWMRDGPCPQRPISLGRAVEGLELDDGSMDSWTVLSQSSGASDHSDNSNVTVLNSGTAASDNFGFVVFPPLSRDADEIVLRRQGTLWRPPPPPPPGPPPQLPPLAH